MLPIRIALGDVNLEGELRDTKWARALAGVLPLTAEFQVWGDEIHFDVPLDEAPPGGTRTALAVGDLAFWSGGGTLCLFFGPTPISPGEEPMAPFPVVVVGRIEGAERLRRRKEAGRLTLQVPIGHED